MALVISAVQVSGMATAYTVPAGKVAKVRLVSVSSFGVGKIFTIGNYTVSNNLQYYAVNSSYATQKGTPNNASGTPVQGFVRLGGTNSAMYTNYVYIKEDHVLVAGETVSCNDNGATFAYTIFEEDA
jgi:hypothetical protein